MLTRGFIIASICILATGSKVFVHSSDPALDNTGGDSKPKNGQRTVKVDRAAEEKLKTNGYTIITADDLKGTNRTENDSRNLAVLKVDQEHLSVNMKTKVKYLELKHNDKIVWKNVNLIGDEYLRSFEYNGKDKKVFARYNGVSGLFHKILDETTQSTEKENARSTLSTPSENGKPTEVEQDGSSKESNKTKRKPSLTNRRRSSTTQLPSEVKLFTTDGPDAHEMDPSKYRVTRLDRNIDEYTFNKGVNCAMIKCNDKDVWKHDPSNVDQTYPESFIYNKRVNTISICFGKEFTTYSFNKGNWEDEEGRASRLYSTLVPPPSPPQSDGSSNPPQGGGSSEGDKEADNADGSTPADGSSAKAAEGDGSTPTLTATPEAGEDQGATPSSTPDAGEGATPEGGDDSSSTPAHPSATPTSGEGADGTTVQTAAPADSSATPAAPANEGAAEGSSVTADGGLAATPTAGEAADGTKDQTADDTTATPAAPADGGATPTPAADGSTDQTADSSTATS